jgi:hypothetical protein
MAHDSENKMDRYSFLVGLFHPQHHAGFGRRFQVPLWFFGYFILLKDKLNMNEIKQKKQSATPLLLIILVAAALVYRLTSNAARYKILR